MKNNPKIMSLFISTGTQKPKPNISFSRLCLHCFRVKKSPLFVLAMICPFQYGVLFVKLKRNSKGPKDMELNWIEVDETSRIIVIQYLHMLISLEGEKSELSLGRQDYQICEYFSNFATNATKCLWPY